MNEDRRSSSPPTDPYSPQRRTALVLTGTGTAGAYHAGVLRALHEAGVKLDMVAGHGVGVVDALFAAVDGAQHLWDEAGFWRAARVRGLYGWGTVPRAIAAALAVSVAIVAVPIAAVAFGLVVFPIDFLLRLVGAGGAVGAGRRANRRQRAFAPDLCCPPGCRGSSCW
jgi:NTE family protein